MPFFPNRSFSLLRRCFRRGCFFGTWKVKAVSDLCFLFLLNPIFNGKNVCFFFLFTCTVRKNTSRSKLCSKDEFRFHKLPCRHIFNITDVHHLSSFRQFTWSGVWKGHRKQDAGNCWSQQQNEAKLLMDFLDLIRSSPFASHSSLWLIWNSTIPEAIHAFLCARNASNKPTWIIPDVFFFIFWNLKSESSFWPHFQQYIIHWPPFSCRCTELKTGKKPTISLKQFLATSGLTTGCQMHFAVCRKICTPKSPHQLF